ncbi:Gfo/Idh/MocA family protein [uncultured Bifidobacterium sp.]|uniref:Gfo/Idh/MocA family protein n=1 Tax=uncultured Bifidobacterium sp. TaxID=165187 RepID=UPI0025854445|nr:Gfo/Idh/MocA family oxidoreductase [uncultured Bifidobacterium sp.]MEE0654292.1 Gfo/Idh/MocA family oxidoreductase [Bifidobacterium criceti]
MTNEPVEQTHTPIHEHLEAHDGQPAADDERPLNVAILGAGRIAQSMARTLTMMAADERYRTLVTPYAVASRSTEKARVFAQQFGMRTSFGSYRDMLDDPDVDLVYIATPHTLHADQAIACMRADKHVLVEKPFAVNVDEARRMLDVSASTGRFCGEAMWTRFMPSRLVIDRIVASGKIGALTSVAADLSYPMTHKKRLTDPDLAGGALLDVGVYPLNFIDMVIGEREITDIVTSMTPYPTGVDAQNTTTLYYDDGTIANATSSMLCASERGGHIRGTNGYVECTNINNVSAVDVYAADHTPIDHIDMPQQLTGYEYEVAAAVRAIRAGRRDCIEMLHADTLRMLALTDTLRGRWGLRYPFESTDAHDDANDNVDTDGNVGTDE